MADVVTLGECLISLIATAPGPLAEAGTFERHIAGAEANVAVGLARLGHSVAYVGRVGAEPERELDIINAATEREGQVEAFKRFLKIETERLRIRHRFGLGGGEIAKASELRHGPSLPHQARTNHDDVWLNLLQRFIVQPPAFHRLGREGLGDHISPAHKVTNNLTSCFVVQV